MYVTIIGFSPSKRLTPISVQVSYNNVILAGFRSHPRRSSHARLAKAKTHNEGQPLLRVQYGWEMELLAMLMISILSMLENDH